MHMSLSDNSWNASICNCSLVACREDRNISRGWRQITRAAFFQIECLSWVGIFTFVCARRESVCVTLNGVCMCCVRWQHGVELFCWFGTAAVSIWVTYISETMPQFWEMQSLVQSTFSLLSDNDCEQRGTAILLLFCQILNNKNKKYTL